MNLINGIQIELERAKKLLKVYQSIPSGVFGATVISQTIESAEKCIRDGDTVEMILVYDRLKKLE